MMFDVLRMIWLLMIIVLVVFIVISLKRLKRDIYNDVKVLSSEWIAAHLVDYVKSGITIGLAIGVALYAITTLILEIIGLWVI